MLDIYVVAGAALVFAVWLRFQFYVLFGDGLRIAAAVFVIYLFVAATLNR